MVSNGAKHPGAWVPLLLPLCIACVTLDGQLFNGVPCTEVGPSTCDKQSAWDRLCTPCGEDYPLDIAYPWAPSFLAAGEAIRVPDAAGVERFEIPTEDGRGALDAMWLSTHAEDADLADFTVIYNHGNFGSLEHYMPRMRILHELGVSVLAWDYRGFGKTTPNENPTSEQWFSDADLIYQAAASRAPSADAIVVYGFSLGAIPAVELALRYGPCAMILEAPMTSLRQIAESTSALSIPGSVLTSGKWENRDKIIRWRGPLLTMSGTADIVFPLQTVRELHAGASSSHKEFWTVEGAGHGVSPPGVPDAGFSEYKGQIQRFLGQANCP